MSKNNGWILLWVASLIEQLWGIHIPSTNSLPGRLIHKHLGNIRCEQRIYLPAQLLVPVVRKNNSALRISTMRALGSDVKSTLNGLGGLPM
jgi:hypothetical protein